MPTAILCPTQRWKSFIKITRKPWESSFRSSQTTLPVGGNHNSKQRDGKEMKKRWKPCSGAFSQRFYNYLAGSTDFGNVSFKIPGIHPFFYIGTDAFNHTEEYTEAAGMSARLRWERERACFLLMKVNCIRCSKPSTCFQVTWFV